ncbi:MAG TPA: photosynthetic reaction center cytochrome c subunit family protein [Bryobacteraceae bacterium]|nr:photosynthetic reaction center cytochrome c subunit family protein [Bryobacteraceae bacterium]
MRTILKRSAFGTAGASILCLAYLTPVSAQTRSSQAKAAHAPSPAERAASAVASGKQVLMAEDVFSNIQVLKGIPVNQFMETMGMFAASLALNCSDCHSAEALSDWSRYSDDVPRKRTARRMILMVNAINKANFGGRNVVTCYTCHHNSVVPRAIPSLAEQYAAPPPPDANDVEVIPGAPAPGPSADQILDRYIQAAGGADKLAALTSYTAKGTYQGFDTDTVPVPVELYAKAPSLRSLVVHLSAGDSFTTFDGRAGWYAGNERALKVLQLPAGPDLDSLKLDADLSFPGRIRQALSDLRAGFPPAAIDDRDVFAVQGMTASKTRVKLFFDQQSGLLVRSVRFIPTPVGTVPVQVDYGDYRDVAGVKLPYQWTMTWTNGRSVAKFTQLETNVPIDNARFAPPPPPTLPAR